MSVLLYLESMGKIVKVHWRPLEPGLSWEDSTGWRFKEWQSGVVGGGLSLTTTQTSLPSIFYIDNTCIKYIFNSLQTPSLFTDHATDERNHQQRHHIVTATSTGIARSVIIIITTHLGSILHLVLHGGSVLHLHHSSILWTPLYSPSHRYSNPNFHMPRHHPFN